MNREPRVDNLLPTQAERAHYQAKGWWQKESVSELVRGRGRATPHAIAYVDPSISVTWREYDVAADRLASQLARLQLDPGGRVAVFLPDGVALHIAYLAVERAGLITVGIPDRAGDRELIHLSAQTGAEVILCAASRRGRSARDVGELVGKDASALRFCGSVGNDGSVELRRVDGEAVDTSQGPSAPKAPVVTPEDLWLINCTSGTTGLPKCVQQTQNRWFYLVALATDAAGLNEDDVIMSLVPGPFGFGLWTAHFVPAVLGASCVLHERFSAESTLRAIAEHRVTVLACVTTQFLLMLASPLMAELDLSSLRVLYTGGEKVPAERAREWESRTGSTVLQFYGSNEAGPFSLTSREDPEELRVGTVGRLAAGVDIRLYDNDGQNVTGSSSTGQPGVRSPGIFGGGYWNDTAANEALLSQDGYLLMPDIIDLDRHGYVSIAGRKSDIIIRGGKNVSAGAVEADVGRHPAVEMVAAVPVPDPVFGERVCAVITVREPGGTLSLSDLVTFLVADGVSKEHLPEYLVVLDELPRSIGGKVAKAELVRQLPELLVR